MIDGAPGYNNYYHDGICAHNRGEARYSAPRHEDPQIAVAWTRGWDRAHEAHATDPYKQSGKK